MTEITLSDDVETPSETEGADNLKVRSANANLLVTEILAGAALAGCGGGGGDSGAAPTNGPPSVSGGASVPAA